MASPLPSTAGIYFGFNVEIYGHPSDSFINSAIQQLSAMTADERLALQQGGYDTIRLGDSFDAFPKVFFGGKTCPSGP